MKHNILHRRDLEDNHVTFQTAEVYLKSGDGQGQTTDRPASAVVSDKSVTLDSPSLVSNLLFQHISLAVSLHPF